eukprot:g20638.t1
MLREYEASVKDKCYFDISIGNRYAGRIVFGLYSDVVPLTCENFLQLCKGYRIKDRVIGYQNTIFHLIKPGSAIAGGDVLDGAGKTRGLSIYGEQFPDENFEFEFVRDGDLAMCNWGKNTNSSVFMITLSQQRAFTNHHVVFGTVLKGMKVVREIGELGTKVGRPAVPIRIVQCGVLDGDTEPPPPLGDLVDESVPLMTEELMCLGKEDFNQAAAAAWTPYAGYAYPANYWDYAQAQQAGEERWEGKGMVCPWSFGRGTPNKEAGEEKRRQQREKRKALFAAPVIESKTAPVEESDDEPTEPMVSERPEKAWEKAAWEESSFESSSEKAKFLRLMGGAKEKSSEPTSNRTPSALGPSSQDGLGLKAVGQDMAREDKKKKKKKKKRGQSSSSSSSSESGDAATQWAEMWRSWQSTGAQAPSGSMGMPTWPAAGQDDGSGHMGWGQWGAPGVPSGWPGAHEDRPGGTMGSYDGGTGWAVAERDDAHNLETAPEKHLKVLVCCRFRCFLNLMVYGFCLFPKAKELILELIDQTKSKHLSSHYVEIPRSKTLGDGTGGRVTEVSGALIGAQGSRIRQFQDTSGARIDIDKSGSRCKVRLTGSQEAITIAKSSGVSHGVVAVPAHQPTSFPATLSESIARARAAAEAVKHGLIPTAPETPSTPAPTTAPTLMVPPPPRPPPAPMPAPMPPPGAPKGGHWGGNQWGGGAW